ncbi:MAG: FkbM family methyltransferase [Elusimicrobiota bacterium]
MRKVKDKIRKIFQKIQIFFKNKLEIKFNNSEVNYSTSSKLAKKWFFPRYIDGSLHEPPVTQLLIEYLNKESVFFDIGANLGFFTVMAAKICYEGEIHAFEMDRRLVNLIKKSVDLNSKVGKVFINNVAVCDKNNKTVEFYPHQKNNLSTNRILNREDKIKQKNNFCTAKTITIDHYCNVEGIKPDIIKIDIEGSETFAVKGMKNIIKEKYPLLIVEIHPKQMKQFKHGPRALIRLLEKWNYTPYIIKNYREKSTGESDNLVEFNQNIIIPSKRPSMFLFKP